MEDNRCPECGAPLHYIYAENIWVCPCCDVEDPLQRRKQMSKMTMTVSFVAGTSLREALIEAREKARKLDVAYIRFSFNSVSFAVSPEADIAKGVKEYKSGETKTIII